MRAVVMVVADVFSEQTLQLAFVNCDDVIQQFAAATAYPTLRNSILPRTNKRRAFFAAIPAGWKTATRSRASKP